MDEQMKHSAEPWHWTVEESQQRDYGGIRTADSRRIGTTVNDVDARHIVACVNACRGIETIDLETAAEIGVMPPMEKIRGLEAQLAQLRAAARDFHNLTIADTTVIIRPESAAQRDAISKAGDHLRTAIQNSVEMA